MQGEADGMQAANNQMIRQCISVLIVWKMSSASRF